VHRNQSESNEANTLVTLKGLGVLCASVSLAACGGAVGPHTTTFSDAVAHSELSANGSVATTVETRDGSQTLATARWTEDTGTFSVTLSDSQFTRTGKLSSGATVEDVEQLAHSLWQDAHGQSPVAQLNPADKSALFDPSRGDVAQALDAAGHRIGFANLTYDVIYDPQRGFLGFDDHQAVLWGWSANLPDRLPVFHHVTRPAGPSHRTTVCWYVNIPDGNGGLITIYGCFDLN
jgi:hypothetical protein